MALFGEKKPAGTPTDNVIQLRQQGTSNDQIIQTLQGQGYASAQIYDAMNQADIKGVVDASPGQQAPEGPMPPAQGEQQMPPQQEAPMPPAQGEQQMPPQQEMPLPEEMPPELPPMPAQDMPPIGDMPPINDPMMSNTSSGLSREEIEEIVEPIIDEKWEELMKNVDKIIAWKESTESKLIKMEQKITDLKSNFDELHAGVLSRIGDYDRSIKDVGAEIKAMDTVFKKVLPTFTDNVSELSRLTKKLKTSKK